MLDDTSHVPTADVVTPTSTLQADADFLAAMRATCTLSAYRTTSFGLRRKDTMASEASDRANNARTGTSTVSVNRLSGADEYHRRITQALTEGKRVFDYNTMPWGQGDGWRLLPNANFERTVAALHQAQKQVEAVLSEYRDAAPEILEQARANLGDHATRVDLPTVDELIESYSIDFEFQPVPDGSAFEGLPTKTRQMLADHVARRTREAYTNAMREAATRIAEVLTEPKNGLIARIDRYEERLKRIDTNPDDKSRDGVFRDSAIERVRTLVEVLPTFNVTGDPVFAEVIDRIGRIGAIEADDLRASVEARATTRAQVQQVNDLLASWGM